LFSSTAPSEENITNLAKEFRCQEYASDAEIPKLMFIYRIRITLSPCIMASLDLKVPIATHHRPLWQVKPIPCLIFGLSPFAMVPFDNPERQKTTQKEENLNVFFCRPL